ncbi:hypothetical protein L612_002100000690 [Rhodococcus rhodochrous J38]|nr:hypothetical protein L612_002100000690 [Rhodococcus rhodochrous J38]
MHHRSLVTGELVEQARLADVRLAHQRDAARSFPTGALTGRGRQLGEKLVEQVAGAAAVSGRYRVGLAESEGPQGCGFGLDAVVVDLVRHEQHRCLGPAQHLRDGLVDAGGAHGGVDDDEDRVGGAHRDLRLAGHGLLHALRVGLPSAGVLHHESAAVPRRLVRDAVAGDARDVLDDRFASADDAVDQGGLADVRSADHGDGRDRDELLEVATLGELDVPVAFFRPGAVAVEPGVIGAQVVAHSFAPVCSATTASSAAITSSMFMSLVSTTTASSAARSGDTARVESRWSRRCTAARTAS